MDRAGTSDVCDVASRACAARCIFVWRRDDVAVLFAGAWRRSTRTMAGDDTLHRDNHRACIDLAQRALDSLQHAGISGQTVQSERLTLSRRLPHRLSEVDDARVCKLGSGG